jgi:SAM-dependent methyltransferase
MSNIYSSGEYLETTQTWHAEDSPWKAAQIAEIIVNNGVHPRTVAEIGCGAGLILQELSRKDHFKDVQFTGYDISAQAIGLSRRAESERVKFYCEDLLSTTEDHRYDLLLVVDVVEHIPDYVGFVTKCRAKAEYKIYHIPLEVHVSSVLRNAFIGGRYTLGHLHYFTAESAMATLRDTGHTIIDYRYTNAAMGLFRQHPSLRRAIANVPRWLFSRVDLPFTARVFGGYSLLLLAE